MKKPEEITIAIVVLAMLGTFAVGAGVADIHNANATASRSFHTATLQQAQGAWSIDINVPPCNGKVINTGASPSGGPLTLTCNVMPIATR
jgi:hypothetical protein